MKINKYLKFKFLLLIVALCSANVTAQKGTVEGVISDENGIYVPGATVLIPALKKGSVSDFNGHFSLVDIPEGSYILKITYLGYADVEQNVTVVSGKTASVSIYIEPKSFELDGVEVISYGLGSQAKALNTQNVLTNR